MQCIVLQLQVKKLRRFLQDASFNEQDALQKFFDEYSYEGVWIKKDVILLETAEIIDDKGYDTIRKKAMILHSVTYCWRN